MRPIHIWHFKTEKSRFKRGWRWLLECILPCTLAYVLFQFLGYSIPQIIVEAGQVKGIDLHMSWETKIPFVPYFFYVYTPSVLFWAFMPFVIYGLYGRKRFYQFFAADLIFSAICFVIYIVLPTQAYLQYNEVVNNHIYTKTDFTTKMVFNTYKGAAPYGECPSGHWGMSLLFFFACCKPVEKKDKFAKAQTTVCACWGVFGALVCMATVFLKQHNFIDGPVTVVLCLLIWFFVTHSKFSQYCDNFFKLINIKLGVEKSEKSMRPVAYDKRHQPQYEVKEVLIWMVWTFIVVVVVVYLLMIIWNTTFGALAGLKLPNYIIPGYHYPSYKEVTQNGSTIWVPYPDDFDSWKPMW